MRLRRTFSAGVPRALGLDFVFYLPQTARRSMAKRESELRSKFLDEVKNHNLLPHAVIIRHEDVRTGGIPDMSVTLYGKTTWWEAKHGTPDFESPGNQELMMMRLAAAGYARYIIWWESASGIGKRTLIVHPREVHERKNWLLISEEATSDFDHRWLARKILERHRVR